MLTSQYQFVHRTENSSDSGGETRRISSTGLPFGLSCAPWVFTKITRAVVVILRNMGICLITYIGDILIIAETESQLKDQTAGLIYLLENLGFVVNHPKSQLQPTQTIEFLGFMVDSQKMELRLPGQKIRNIRADTNKLRTAETVTALDLSRFLGKLNSTTQAISVAPLFYRQLQDNLQAVLRQNNQDYSGMMTLTRGAREELEWWMTHLTNWNGRSLISQKLCYRWRPMPPCGNGELYARESEREAPGQKRSGVST